MRGGYPIHVKQVERWKKAETYWECSGPTNSKFKITCGHKHATEAQARKCMDAVTTAYRLARWPKKGKS